MCQRHLVGYNIYRLELVASYSYLCPCHNYALHENTLGWSIFGEMVESFTHLLLDSAEYLHFYLGTEVPRRSAGIDRTDRPTVDETESTKVRMRLRKRHHISIRHT